MGYVHKYDSNGSSEIGDYGEKLFETLAIRRGYSATKLEGSHQWKKHTDFRISKNGVTYIIEVKGLKRVNRHDEYQTDSMICIEIQGNSGHPGWIYGKSDYIAFLCNDGFIIVKTKELANRLPEFVDLSQKVEESPTFGKVRYKLYNRGQYGHKDIITFIDKKDLLKLKHTKWKI